MQVRYTALTASLIMGSIHAVWHYPSGISIGQNMGLIVWGTLLTVSFRVLTVWLYNNTRNSVFAAILFHAVTNTGRSVFPGGRSSYELGDVAVGYAIITITAVIVVFLWGSGTWLDTGMLAQKLSPLRLRGVSRKGMSPKKWGPENCFLIKPG